MILVLNITAIMGFCLDLSSVGKIDEEYSEVYLDVTEESLYKGLEEAKPGERLSNISHAIQTYVEANGFSIVREYVGHGVGQDLHEDPQYSSLWSA